MPDRTRTPALLLMLIAAALGATAAVAAEDDASARGWLVRANGFIVDPDGQLGEVTVGGTTTRTGNEAGAGFGVGGEYRFTQRLGVELGLLRASEFDVRVQVDALGTTIVDTDTFDMTSLSGGLNLHLTPSGAPVDLYLAPMLVWIDFSDVVVRGTGPPGDLGNGQGRGRGNGGNSVRLSIDDDFTFGASVGLDVPLGDDGWLFNANVRYLAADLDSEDPFGGHQRVGYDPLLAGVGFGYRF